MGESLYLRWAECCKRAGLGEPSRAHGLKLHDGSKAAAYASKWGLEDEMTKGHTKKALHGETPFDFLRSFLADGEDKQAAALFREFAETFKGKRQLHWSRGSRPDLPSRKRPTSSSRPRLKTGHFCWVRSAWSNGGTSWPSMAAGRCSSWRRLAAGMRSSTTWRRYAGLVMTKSVWHENPVVCLSCDSRMWSQVARRARRCAHAVTSAPGVISALFCAEHLPFTAVSLELLPAARCCISPPCAAPRA